MEKLLIVLSHGTDDVNKATRAIHLAKIAREQGRDVKIFLLDDGVNMAKAGIADNMRTVTGDIAADILTYLEDFEVPMYVCTPCAKIRGIAQADMLKNASFETGATLIRLTLDHSVISF